MANNPKNFAATFQDLHELLQIFQQIADSSIQRNFSEGGRYGGGVYGGGSTKWTPSKAALARGGQTLVDRGGLKSSTAVTVTGARQLTITVGKVYGAVHNYGGATGRKHSVILPARPFAVLQDSDIEDMKAAATEYWRNKFA